MSDRGEAGALLHNMSTPPKSVMKYSGLKDLAPGSGSDHPDASTGKFKGAGVFGTPVRFVLPAEFKGRSPSFLLRLLGIAPQQDPAQQLSALINTRANELPLPDGCAVIPALAAHPILWNDSLSALAILAKCSDSIWLRDKTPALSTALQHKQVSLLVPPLFASRLPRAPL